MPGYGLSPYGQGLFGDPPMTAASNGWEGQTPATNVSPANSAASGTALTTVTPGAGGSIAYSNAQAAHGTMSIRFTPANGVASLVDRAIFNSTRVADYTYLYLTALPTAPTDVVHFRQSAALLACKWQINAAGHLSLQNAAGTGLTGFTGVLPTNQWIRVEMSCLSDASAGTLFCAWYLGDSTTPEETSGLLTGVNTRGGNITIVRKGKITASTWASAFYLDDESTQDGTTTIPALPVPPTPYYWFNAAGEKVPMSLTQL